MEKNKIKFFGLVFFLAVLSVFFLFFHFAKTKKQNITIQKKQEIVSNAQTPPVTIASVADNIIESEKIVPVAMPIFMYHYIRKYTDANDPIGVNLSVPPEKFEEHLAWLKENGYESVFPNFFKDPKALALKPIILTFDDGYEDAYTSAFPLLQKYKMKGVFYLIVSKIGTPGYLNWEEILEMQKAGMAFGSHTLAHPDLRNLDIVNLEKEIKESREILGQKLREEITDFCYPSGKYSDVVMAELRKDNYETAVTTNSGISSLKDDPFLLKRLRITEKSNIQTILNRNY
jgi:peptidoglycan/xylan/chitin deacetylase (PgdA/CDA1 family)